MKVVLAEKPSVARDLASHLGARSRNKGFFEGNGWWVTWAFGHMVELQEPEDYNPQLRSWRLRDLPIIPQPFELRARQEGSAGEQLNTIRKLFQEADAIVCATDAGREGELIFRYILTWSGCQGKPCQRLWISSLTNAAITKGFANLLPSARFDRLYEAARCRSEADWIVGLNATRFFTLEYGKRNLLLSVGRVQTPILAMIVHRDLEIDYFKPSDYWEVHTLCEGAVFKLKSAKFEEADKGMAVVDAIKELPLEITAVSKKKERAYPPQLYDLTALQQDMNRMYGFTADQTLRLAQDLYESKNLSYPRTDSRYISSDIQPSIAPLLEALRVLWPEAVGGLDLNHLKFDKRIVDDKKVTDHHAILPTEVMGDRLQGNARKLYDAVVLRLIAVFYPACIQAVTEVDASAGKFLFRARGKVLVDAGWRGLYPKWESRSGSGSGQGGGKPGRAEAESVQAMPDFQEGATHAHEPSLKAFKTSPPKRFNEATLLQLMETAGKTVTDETLKEALKEKGVGTPATRASMIEVLIQRHYVERKKKNLISTESGRGLVSLIRDERLKSPELTGEWEFKLKQIERGSYDPDVFIKEVGAYTRELLEATVENTSDPANLGPCPLCHARVIRGRRAYGCSAWKSGCPFVLPFEVWGLPVPLALVRELLAHKRSLTPHPLWVDGKSVFANLSFDGSGHLAYAPAPIAKKAPGAKRIGPCPACGGDVVAGEKAYGCSNWKNGCGFVIWKVMAQRAITLENARQLLEAGHTEVLTGFHSKAGKTFDAPLKVEAGRVCFDFGES